MVNGTRATVTDISPATRSLRVRTDDNLDLTLPASYLDAGHVTHGYAIIGHKAQGLTVDHTFVLGSPELYREWGYVALSRGRQSNRLYVHGSAATSTLSLTNGLRRLRNRQERTELKARVDRNRTALVETEEHLRQVEVELAALPGEATIVQAQDQFSALTRELSDIADLRVAAAERDPPRYLLRSLGAPPDDARGRSLWREAARTVESYRLRWDITDPARPLADEPHDPLRQAEHRCAASALDRNRRELSRELISGRSRGLETGLGR